MQTTVETVMRDGVTLMADVTAPNGRGPWPVLVIRTPYGRKSFAGISRIMSGSGYVVFAQDVRGTGDSEGQFGFFSQEPADAVDTARWILQQNFCDGRLGIIGISYLSCASLAIAAEYPQNVKAALWITLLTGEDTTVKRGGALRLHHTLAWMGLHDPRSREVDWQKMYRRLPLARVLADEGFRDTRIWEEIACNGREFWKKNDLSHLVKRVDVPAIHFAGFWDFLLDASIKGYIELKQNSKSPQVLFLGPWSHNGIASEIPNKFVDYGKEASSRLLDRTVAWFNHWIKGSPLPEDLAHPVSVYIHGRGWMRFSSWPPEGTSELTLYLTEDGTLSQQVGSTAALSYDYDPNDPVPTEGGAIWEFPKAGLDPGPRPQTSHQRSDVLVFDGPELKEDTVLLGPAQAILHVQTEAPSTDFTVKLVDVDPYDLPRIIADSIIRVEDWADLCRPVVIPLEAVGHLLEAGHRLRVEVSSSNFPKYDRNLNTGCSGLTSDQVRVAHQTLRVGAGSASRVVLTVFSRVTSS